MAAEFLIRANYDGLAVFYVGSPPNLLIVICRRPGVRGMQGCGSSASCSLRIRAFHVGRKATNGRFCMIAFYGMGLPRIAVRACAAAPRRTGPGMEPLARKGPSADRGGGNLRRRRRSGGPRSSRIHLTLSDDAAVDNVLEQARPGIEKGTVIVDRTTTSARRGTQSGHSVGRTRNRLPACSAIHGAAKRARGNRDHARVG